MERIFYCTLVTVLLPIILPMFTVHFCWCKATLLTDIVEEM